jgi:hypothetical protein
VKRLLCALALSLVLAAPVRAAGPFQPLLGQSLVPGSFKSGHPQSGFLRVGRFSENRSGPAARPDGSGVAANLYQLALQDALAEGRAAWLGDALFLTDAGHGLWRLSSLDYLLGAAVQDEAFRLQVDREEALPLDRGGSGFRVWDLRASLRMAQAPGKGGEAAAAKSGAYPLRAALTLGWYFKNAGYPSRPDGTGKAFLRYAAEAEAALSGGRLLFSAGAQFLTDDHRRRYSPASAALSLGAGTSLQGLELWATREERRVLDGPGYDSCWLFSLRAPF